MSSAAPQLTAPTSTRRRGARLAGIVAVSCGVVATGITGAGLLLPAASPTPALRVIGAVVAVAAAGALVRLDGAARGVTALAVLSATALGVCLVTLPVSPVAHPWTATPDPPPAGDAPDAGDGTGRDVVLEPAPPGGGAPEGDVAALPPGAGLGITDDGSVVLELPDGGRIVIGEATVGGQGGQPGVAGAVTVTDGVAGLGGGRVLGPDVELGGTTFERSDGSRVAVGDGVLLEVPAPLPTEETDPTDGLDALLALLLGCFALVAFAPPIVRFGERVGVSLLDEPEAEEEPDGRAPASVEEGLADVLRSMLSDPDPRTAVIGAYARLLTALAEAGYPRRDEEGPHEHLWRTLGPLGVRRQPVHQLAELFVRARFTPKPITEEHRQAAIGALADAVADLRLLALDVDEVAARTGVPA